MGAGCCISANLRNNTDMRQNGNSRMEGQGRGGRGVINGKPGFGENKLVFDDDICPASCNYGRRSRNNIQVLLAGLILLFTVQSCLYGRSDMNLPHTCRSCKLNFPPPRPLPPPPANTNIALRLQCMKTWAQGLLASVFSWKLYLHFNKMCCELMVLVMMCNLFHFGILCHRLLQGFLRLREHFWKGCQMLLHRRPPPKTDKNYLKRKIWDQLTWFSVFLHTAHLDCTVNLNTDKSKMIFLQTESKILQHIRGFKSLTCHFTTMMGKFNHKSFFVMIFETIFFTPPFNHLLHQHRASLNLPVV